MTDKTLPVFIVGSGRSGSRMMFRLFAQMQNIESHHEYCVSHLQQLAGLKYLGQINRKKLLAELKKIYGAALYYSAADYFIDSSNKVSWLIPELAELFPQAKFINITRDGRKVACSFFNKFKGYVYDDHSVAATMRWLSAPKDLPVPPPNIKYWWPIPQGKHVFAKEFESFNRFQRICFYWQEVYQTITQSLDDLPPTLSLTVKLEELTASETKLQKLFEFLGLKYDVSYFKYMQKPQGVIEPIDYKLTLRQREEFAAIGAEMMTKLGYDLLQKEYQVKY